MEKKQKISTNTNDFIKKLTERLESYFEEISYFTHEAGETFIKNACKIIEIYYKISSPEISKYVDKKELEEYILEYFRHYYMANLKKNGYIFAQMRMDIKTRKGEESGEREKKRLREHEKEYIEELGKYSLNGLYVKLVNLYNKIVESGVVIPFDEMN